MAVTGHKSLQSLAIYQRVKSDEKMMMGMSLMYNLLKPEDVMVECNPTFDQPPPQQLSSIQFPNGTENKADLDVHKENVIPKECNALQPYQQPTGLNTSANNIYFDILEFIANTEDDDQLVLAATQVEKIQHQIIQ